MVNKLRPAGWIIGVVAMALIVTLSVVVWNTQDHEARIGAGWAIPALVVAVATWRDVRSRPAATMRAALVVAVAWFYFLGFLTVMVLLFGWIFSVLGIIFGMPATALAWLARKRVGQGQVDGAVLTAGMLVAVGAFTLSRPWTPSSQEWLWGAGVAFAGAAVVVGDVVARGVRHAA